MCCLFFKVCKSYESSFSFTKLPRSPDGLAALRAGAHSHWADRLGSTGEGRHAVNWRSRRRRRAAVHRAGVERNGHSGVRVKGNNRRRARGKSRVGDEEGKLAVAGGDQLEAAEDFGGHRLGGAELGGSVDGQRGRQLDVQRLRQVRLLGRGLLRVVHGHHLAHAAGQVAEKPRPHLRVHALGGGEKAGHLVHALIEAGPVFAEDAGIS